MRKPRKPAGVLKKAAADYQRKATNTAITGLYEVMWGEKPKRGRPKKNDK